MKKLLLSAICLSLFPIASLYSQHRLIWSDEFNSKQLAESNWTIASGYGSQNDGWGNKELQNYTSNNISFKKGKLVITAKKVGDDKKRGDYTSSRISTKNKQTFLYGRIEARMKLATGKGVWPAFWMLGTEGGWPDGGEIDIMEYVGYQPGVAHSALHTRSSHGATINKKQVEVKNLEKGFHIYGINWDKDKIEFYIDDPEAPFYVYAPEKKTPQNWPFDKPQYILFNLAVGGNWGGKMGIDNSIFPQDFIIDWVRVYTN